MNEDTGRGSLTVVDFTVAKAQITKIFVSGAIFGLGIAFLFLPCCQTGRSFLGTTRCTDLNQNSLLSRRDSAWQS